LPTLRAAWVTDHREPFGGSGGDGHQLIHAAGCGLCSLYPNRSWDYSSRSPVVGGVAGSLAGTRVARHLSGTGHLTIVFAGLIFVVAAYMLWKGLRG